MFARYAHILGTLQQGDRVCNYNSGLISYFQGHDIFVVVLNSTLHGVALDWFQYILNIGHTVETVLLGIEDDKPELINVFLFGV